MQQYQGAVEQTKKDFSATIFDGITMVIPLVRDSFSLVGDCMTFAVSLQQSEEELLILVEVYVYCIFYNQPSAP